MEDLRPDQIPAAQAESDSLGRSFLGHLIGSLALINVGGIIRDLPLHAPMSMNIMDGDPLMTRMKAYTLIGAGTVVCARGAMHAVKSIAIQTQLLALDTKAMNAEIQALEAQMH
jgi:hypothetical protein